jgi:hypothetical protein
MPLSQNQCKQFNDYLGRRPYPWDKKIAKDRKPREFIYVGMYKTSKWAPGTETVHLHEKVYVARPNDPGMWPQYFADPCLGSPCDMSISYIGHGVDQLAFGRFRKEIRSSVFCLDQLNTIEEAETKLDAIVEGYKKVPEDVAGGFIRQLALRQAGLSSQGAGLWLCGVQDAYNNPASIDMNDNMFAISSGGNAGTVNGLFMNLNANGQLDALVTAGKISSATTVGLVPYLSQLTMEYLANHQEDLAGQGYHDGEWSVAGKFTITMDGTTSRRLTAANPALTGLYKAADFEKAGVYYSLGMAGGCGDWLFKKDPQQLRFNFRQDLDGHDLNGNVVARAVWLEQIQPFQNVPATFGIKPLYSPLWKAAPIRIYHCFNRDARECYVGDVTSVNSDMKFGLARSFMGNMTWKHPDYFTAFDPASGSVCEIENVKDNKGFFLGEYDLGIKTIYPEIERWILALGEATPYTRRPNTVTPATTPSSYQDLIAYNAHCASPDNDTSYVWGQSAFAYAVGEEVQSYSNIGGGDFVGYQTGIEPI